MDKRSARRTNRRSGRVPLSMRLVITPAECQHAFRADSQTINVSAHGARICTNVDLATDMQIRVFQPWRNRIQIARVIWAEVTGVRQYGIELLSEDDFWGIHFPSDRLEDTEAEEKSETPSAEQTADAEGGALEEFPTIAVSSGLDSVTTPQTHRRDAIVGFDPLAGIPEGTRREEKSSHSIEVPQSGLAVMVSGISMAGQPFRENGVLLPQGTERTTAYLWLRSVIRDGSSLRISFPNNFFTTVKVRATFDTRSPIKETLAAVELPPGLYLSVGEMA